MQRCLFSTLALAGMLAAGSTTAETYTCKFVQSGPGKTIPEVVVIEHDTGSGRVSVIDPFINNYVGAPLTGTLKSKNETRTLFAWQLPALKDENGHWIPGIAFSVNIIRASGQASISSAPSGNYERARGSGNCSVK